MNNFVQSSQAMGNNYVFFACVGKSLEVVTAQSLQSSHCTQLCYERMLTTKFENEKWN